MAFFVVFIGCPAHALTEKQINLYSQNDIYFYDSGISNCEEMDETGDEDNTPIDEWDGHCSDIGVYGDKILQYYDAIHTIALNNGLPWEAIVAQLIGESSFMAHEVCAFNPLGLKGEPSCDGKHRIFSSYEEAFNYYVNSIKPVREAMGKFRNDPYGYVDFIINGVPGYKYATDPEYINKISGYVCGVQKWAFMNGKPISGMPNGNSSSSGSSSSSGGISIDDIPFCTKKDNDTDDDDDDTDDITKRSPLVNLLLAWAWPEYHKAPYTTRMPDYAAYMDNVATYHPDGGVDCGAFVSNIIIASGWDLSYPAGPVSSQKTYLSSSWNEVSAKSRKLGDVGVKKTGHHVILYVGNIPGFGSTTASASMGERAPMAGSSGENLDNYTWYRKK